MTSDERMIEILKHAMPAIDLLLKYLKEGIALTVDQDQVMGYAPESDTATFSARVRQYVRTQMRNHYPDLPARAPMSPVHLTLGPYQLRVLHAQDGSLPRADNPTRERLYALNDQGLFSLNVFPPDGLVNINEDEQEVQDGSLILTWDSADGMLTLAQMWLPSMAIPPGQKYDLLTATVVQTEDDIPIRKSKEQIEKEESGEGGDARRTASGDPSGEVPPSNDQDEDGE